jgi:hypothetical protein
VGIVSSLGVRLYTEFDDAAGIKDISKDIQELVVDFVSFGSMMTDLSEKTGLTTDDLQKLSLAGDLAGVSINQIASAATMLAKRIGTGEAREGIEAMGLNFEHIKSLDMGAQFTTVAQAMGQMESQNQIAVAGADAFGRGWSNVLPVAKQDLEALGRELENTGGLVKSNLIDRADQAGDAWTRLDRIISGWKRNIVGGLLEKPVQALEQDIKDINKIADLINDPTGVGKNKIPGHGRMPGGVWEGPNQFGSGMTSAEQADIEERFGKNLVKNNRLIDEQAKKTKEFWAWLNDGPVQWKEGLSSMPGQQIGWKMPEIPWANGPKMQSGISGSLPVSSMLGWGTPQEYAAAFAPPPGTFETIAAKLKMDAVVPMKDVALAGAKSLIDTLGMGIATGDWSAFKTALSTGIQSFATSAIATGINAIIPGLGTLLQPLIGGFVSMIGGLFDRHKGRDSVVAFAAEMGGFDALHAKLLQLGAEGEALWVKLTQGTPSGNKDIAKANINEVIAALERQRAVGSTATDGLNSDLGAIAAAAGPAKLSLEELIALQAKLAAGSMGGGIHEKWSGSAAERYAPGSGGGIHEEWSGSAAERYAPGSVDIMSQERQAALINEVQQHEAQSRTTINMTVNGSADRDFAARLAKAIADGGGLRTEWQAAVG